jgi:hypothetical protein
MRPKEEDNYSYTFILPFYHPRFRTPIHMGKVALTYKKSKHPQSALGKIL